MAKAGGIFGDLFGKKKEENNDAVAKAKAKQKAEADARAAAAAKAQGKKDDGRIPNKADKAEKKLSPKATLTVNGKWDAATTKAVQTAIGTPTTGEAWINNADAKVLQKKLGVKADGLFGKASNTALQKHLKVTADGVFGPNSVKALQKALNAGTFFSA